MHRRTFFIAIVWAVVAVVAAAWQGSISGWITWALAGTAIVLGVVSYLLTSRWQMKRVEQWVESKGGTLRSVDWSRSIPQRGWVSRDSDGYINVIYRDRSGRVCEAFIKFTLLQGVVVFLDEPMP